MWRLQECGQSRGSDIWVRRARNLSLFRLQQCRHEDEALGCSSQLSSLSLLDLSLVVQDFKNQNARQPRGGEGGFGSNLTIRFRERERERQSGVRKRKPFWLKSREPALPWAPKLNNTCQTAVSQMRTHPEWMESISGGGLIVLRKVQNRLISSTRHHGHFHIQQTRLSTPFRAAPWGVRAQEGRKEGRKEARKERKKESKRERARYTER